MKISRVIGNLRNSRMAVALHHLLILANPLEILDMKMVLKLRSLKPLKRVEKFLLDGESYHKTGTTHVLKLFIGRFVSLKICRGESMRVQVQGLTGEEDLKLLLARMKTLHLMIDGEPKVNRIICESAIPVMEDLAVHLVEFEIRSNYYKIADATIVIKGGRAIFIGSRWDDIDLCADVLGPFIVA